MADKQYGVSKVAGFTASAYESLTSHFEYVMINTKVPVFTYNQWLNTSAANGGGTSNTDFAGAAISQGNLDKLIQIISERGQPVIMGNVIFGAPAPAATYQVTMAIEHPNAWASAQNATSTNVPTFATLTAMPGGPGWPDVRLNEDLKSRIMSDGINYGFGANVSGINDIASLLVTISNSLPDLP